MQSDDLKLNSLKSNKHKSSKRQPYFEAALSDFVYDAASGRAIRHLVQCGYTTEQIMHLLNYPTPRYKVEKTVYRYLKETGVIVTQFPISLDQMQSVVIKCPSEDKLYCKLKQYIQENGQENSYLSCPFGIMDTNILLSPLTLREKEYILGIAWESFVVYHQLNQRMLEIGSQLAFQNDIFSFYFLKSMEILTCST